MKPNKVFSLTQNLTQKLSVKQPSIQKGNNTISNGTRKLALGLACLAALGSASVLPKTKAAAETIKPEAAQAIETNDVSTEPVAVVWLNQGLPASVLRAFDDDTDGYVDRAEIINVPANPFNEIPSDLVPLVMGHKNTEEYKVNQVENHFDGAESAVWIGNKSVVRTFDDDSDGLIDRTEIVKIPENPFNEIPSDLVPLVMGDNKSEDKKVNQVKIPDNPFNEIPCDLVPLVMGDNNSEDKKVNQVKIPENPFNEIPCDLVPLVMGD